MGEKRKRSHFTQSEVSQTRSFAGVAADAGHWQAELVVWSKGGTPEKRQKVGSAEFTTTQPLTRENLALLEGKMPSRSATEGGETSATKTTKTNTSTADIRKQEEVLHYNNIEVESEEASQTKLGEDIMEAAQELVQEHRHSAMSKKRAELFIKKRKDRQYSNEATFVDVMWKILIEESRHVQQAVAETQGDDDEWMEVGYEDDGLRHNRDQQFRKNSVPVKDSTGARDMEKFLRKLPGIPYPVPDLTYGLRRDAFTTGERLVSTALEHISAISPDMLYPFFVVEFKSGKGDFQAAVLQACRGGAALIYSMRQLREEAGLKNNNDQSDVGRMTFSMAMNTIKANIYVHWADGAKKGKVVYHMARLDGFDLEKKEDIPKLRSHINNILDWGILKRKTYIRGLLAIISPAAAETSGAEDEEEEDDDDEDEENEEEGNTEDEEDPLSGR